MGSVEDIGFPDIQFSSGVKMTRRMLNRPLSNLCVCVFVSVSVPMVIVRR